MSPAKQLISSVLIDEQIYYDVSEIVHLNHFNGQDREIWLAIENLIADGKRVTSYAIRETSSNVDSDYLSSIALLAADPSNAELYAERVVEQAIRRQMFDIGTDLVNASRDPGKNIDDVLNSATDQISSLDRGTLLTPIDSVAKRVAEEFNDYVNNPIERGSARFLDTEWKNLNAIQSGWRPGLYIYLGVPHCGKTWGMLHACANVARHGKRALLFSLEMTANELVKRLTLAYAGVSDDQYIRGDVSENEEKRVRKYLDLISNWNLDIYDSSERVQEILATIYKEMRSTNPPDLIAVDYLGLISTNTDEDNENYRISNILNRFKNTSRRLQVPILMPHQVSDKAISRRKNKEPKISDGYGSGGISQHADVVVGIYCDRMYHKPSVWKNITQWIFLKDRLSGQTGATIGFWVDDFGQYKPVSSSDMSKIAGMAAQQ